MGILHDLIRTIEGRRLFRRGDGVLLALSGGPDSTVLAHLVASLREEWTFRLMALHVNHKLRGEESEEDEQFVRSLCDSLALPLVVREGRLPERRGRGVSLQSEAREIRYAILEEERRAAGLDAIATGHNRDDRAETLLLNLFRGSGVRGLAGIPYRRGTVVRPLLDVARADIEAFLRAGDLGSRTDRTNLEDDYDRNKVRHHIVPFVEEVLGRSVAGPLARAADVASELDAFVTSLAGEWIAQAGSVAEGAFRRGVRAASLAALPKALGREVVRAGIESACGSLRAVTLETVDRVLGLARPEGAGVIELPGGFEARREGELIIFGEPLSTAPAFEIPLSVPGSAELPGGTVVRVRKGAIPAGGPPPGGGDIVYLDAGRLSPPLTVRCRAGGDRFHPLGAPGSRKVQDLMVDRKVPRRVRDRVPVLTDSDGIVWVGGVEIAERAKVTAETTEVLEVAIAWAD